MLVARRIFISMLPESSFIKDIRIRFEQDTEEKNVLRFYPVVNKLEETCLGLSIQWLIKCIQIYSDECHPDKLSQLNFYLELLMHGQTVLTSEQSMQIAQEIWLLPERDLFQTAISRLWAAISALQKKDTDHLIMEAIFIIELLLDLDSCLLEYYLKEAGKIYERSSI